MKYEKLENILELVGSNPVELKRFSNDIQQINPEARIYSIKGILENINLTSNSTVVDIGTGYGYGAVLLNALGYNVIGVDSNRNKLEEGLKYWEKLGISFKVIDDASEALQSKDQLYFLYRNGRNLGDIPDCSIDMVTFFFIGSYMLGKKGPLPEAVRILKSRSPLIITSEGPIKAPELFRGAVIRLMTYMYKPQNLRHEKTIVINNINVYDKYVIRLIKK